MHTVSATSSSGSSVVCSDCGGWTAAALGELRVQPAWTDNDDGFSAVGVTGVLHERVEVVARRSPVGVEVSVRSQPRWPFVILDPAGRSEANVQRLTDALQTASPLPADAVAPRAAPAAADRRMTTAHRTTSGSPDRVNAAQNQGCAQRGSSRTARRPASSAA